MEYLFFRSSLLRVVSFAYVSFEARSQSPRRRLRGLDVSLPSRESARVLIPPAAVLPRPLQHLEVAALRRARTRLPVPRELLRAQRLQLLEISVSRRCRTRETLVLQNTARVPVLQQTHVSEVHGFIIRQLLDLTLRCVHRVAHAFAHRAEPTEIRGLRQKVRSENVRGDHVDGKARDVLSRGGGIHASNRGHYVRKSTRRVCVVRSCAVSLLPRSAGDLAKGCFFLGRYDSLNACTKSGCFWFVRARHKAFFAALPASLRGDDAASIARSDVRDSGTTSVDIQTHCPALKLRVSISVSLIRRVHRAVADRAFFANTVFRDGSPRTVGRGFNRPMRFLRATTHPPSRRRHGANTS